MGVSRTRTVLIVDRDAHYGRALSKLLRNQGDDVRLATTAAGAQRAVRERRFDLAIVDVLQDGGGAELARSLASRVRRLVLSVGASLDHEELLETALGFPVRRKAMLPELLHPQPAPPGTPPARRPAARRRLAAHRH
jgi:CheY-like chemotaxis protein